MGLIKYESHSGYISHIILEEDLSNVFFSHTEPLVNEGESDCHPTRI